MDTKQSHTFFSARQALSALALGSIVLLTGCASTQTKNPQDPFEGYNRAMTSFNDGVDQAVLRPVAKTYQSVTPQPIRTGVSNFFGNIGDLWSMVNHGLQGNGEKTYTHLVRFTTNTVLGFGGILDLASEMQLPRDKQDFGLTLGSWGVQPGPYLVLPLLGPSTVRDTVALPVDAQGNLLGELSPVSHRNALTVLRLVDTRTNLLGVTDSLDAAALDRYSLMRDFYLKQRDPARRSAQDDENDGRVESYDD